MTDPLSALPLFATDREIAIAVVGKERASMYVKAVIPTLERKGFPRIDPLHDGRPVLLVRRFYDGYLGITADFQVARPDGGENLGVWDRSAGKRRNARKPQLGLNARCLGALRYMVEHTDVRTSVEVPGATDFTMKELAAKGALIVVASEIGCGFLDLAGSPQVGPLPPHRPRAEIINSRHSRIHLVLLAGVRTLGDDGGLELSRENFEQDLVGLCGRDFRLARHQLGDPALCERGLCRLAAHREPLPDRRNADRVQVTCQRIAFVVTQKSAPTPGRGRDGHMAS